MFEYYISHHYAKAFESLFGIVTCLPGCFSMFRIKAPKNGAWVPLLANPDIILEYNQNVVTTLHEKNLLLLGEDRFLSTLMLRTFPKRQMMFVPQARCRTIVPDEFKVLLSQRRRWINSTIHNLMELVLVSDLCGIACLSMQFSIFVDLIAALVLPAAIVMTIYLIISSALSTNPQWTSLGLLICILFLPAILIGITTLKFVYIAWMISKFWETSRRKVRALTVIYKKFTSLHCRYGTLCCRSTRSGTLTTFHGARRVWWLAKRRTRATVMRRASLTRHGW